MRRNFKITILLLIGIVGLTTFSLVKLPGPASGPISLGLQSYTNACAVVTVTNLSRFQFDYSLKLERKTMDGWPRYQGGMPLGIDSGQGGVLPAGKVLTLTVPVMVYAPPYPWRVSIFCYRNAKPPNPNTIRSKACLWLLRLTMPKLAQKLWGESKVVQVSGPQMEQ